MILRTLFAAAILSSCAAPMRSVTSDACDDIYFVALTDYISHAPADARAKAFRITINDNDPSGHDPSQRLFRRLRSQWPTIRTENAFEREFASADQTWGWFAAELRRHDARSAEVIAWCPYYEYRRYVLERAGDSWRIVSSEVYTPG